MYTYSSLKYLGTRLTRSVLIETIMAPVVKLFRSACHNVSGWRAEKRACEKSSAFARDLAEREYFWKEVQLQWVMSLQHCMELIQLIHLGADSLHLPSPLTPARTRVKRTRVSFCLYKSRTASLNVWCWRFLCCDYRTRLWNNINVKVALPLISLIMMEDDIFLCRLKSKDTCSQPPML